MVRRATLGFLLFASAFANQPSKPAIHLDRDGEKWAARTLRKLTLEEKVGQLLMVWARVQFLNVASPDYLKLQDTLMRYHVGSFGVSVPFDGPFLLRNQPYEAAALTNQLQHESKLPLLFAADFERGLSMRLYGATVFPHAMAFGAAGKKEYAESFGLITGLESRAIGIHWNFFPDADVNSNPANPIINTRSFGEDPQQVGELLTAYITGAHAAGMMTTAKHFPGHGDTGTDSHLGVAQVNGDRARLDAVELAPFRAAIAAGVDSVMVAHVTVPALEPDPNRVATTSPGIVSGLLKQQLGFSGIVVTDALDMGALTRLYATDPGRPCVDALKAGSDLLLIPADIDACYQSVLAALRKGEIPVAQIDASVLKMLRAKAALGLHKSRFVDPAALPYIIAKPENVAVGQHVADDALTLVRDNQQVLPLAATAKDPGTAAPRLPYQTVEHPASRLLLVIITDDVRLDWGRELDRQVRLRDPGARVMYVDARFAAAVSDDLLRSAGEAEKIAVAVYAVPSAGRAVPVGGSLKSTVGLGDATGPLLATLLERAAAKTIVVAMGNPYLAGDFPAVQNYLCTFSNATVSEVSAARALFGEIPIHGRLPVTIPNIAQRGAGLDRPAAGSGGHTHGHR
jgi:beta-N-acetylhexosaminidase